MRSTFLEQLEHAGYCLLPQAADLRLINQLRQDVESILQGEGPGVLRSREVAYGVRNLLQVWPRGVLCISQLPAAQALIEAVLGPEAGVVRALLFDKPPERSWTLPWHRDRTIAVREIPDRLYDFSNPTRKAGVEHLVAPNWLLRNMLTLRLALDPMTEENGPLVVLPGSHRGDGNSDDDLPALESNAIQTILCNAGDLFVMRPLLAHSSLRSLEHTQQRRRVVHVELAGRQELPEGLHWKEFLSF